jgi:hypothetical protein
LTALLSAVAPAKNEAPLASKTPVFRRAMAPDAVGARVCRSGIAGTFARLASNLL